MTEAEWLACDDPLRILEFLRGKVSDRKLRLLACANCRLLWKWMADQRSQQAVVVAERLSDGLASEEERSNAFAASFEAATLDEYEDPEDETIYLRSMTAAYAHNAVWDEAFVAAHANSPSVSPELTGLSDTLPLHLLRDIFGNQFRPATLNPAWLTSDVRALAEGIYAGRAFDRMPILADALQDAGCDNPDILSHCRDTALTHVRGCWVVDLVLGKV
jgi:hypothetical protein